MKIMGIDASSKSTGIAIFEDKKLIFYDCLTASSTDPINRIQKIVKNLQLTLQKYPIEKIIIEEVRPQFGSNNVTNLHTQKILMWLQAAIAFMIHDNFPKIQIEYVYPGQWRKACGIKTGRGIRRDSLKIADIAFVNEYYSLDIKSDDIADAICIAHSYVNQLSNEINWE